VHTRACNNAATNFTADRKATPFPTRVGVERNVISTLDNLRLEDPEHFDFRPRADSPLVDAGAQLPGFDFKYVGTAPDAGAYEFGAPRWIPGRRTKEPAAVSSKSSKRVGF
jgi:hypothetical protein